MNHKLKVIIQKYATSQSKIKIFIEPNKTIYELIKFFFEKIHKPELFGDPSIRFLINAKYILYDSKDLIRKYINVNNKTHTIVVDDLDDKLGHF